MRKLTPESWGFLCPVHTPDGSLCGLLNHMTFMCEVCTDEPGTEKLTELLKQLGLIPLQSGIFKFSINEDQKQFFYEVLLNGKLLGYVEGSEAATMVKKLRYLKALSTTPHGKENPMTHGLSKHMEICHIPKIELSNCTYSLYPGVYIFTTPGRMMRPVKNLTTGHTEYIGTMEQCYLNVCIKPEEFNENVNFLLLKFCQISE